MALYIYGMKLRGFSPGCQPSEGFVERREDTNGRYWDLLVYNRLLSFKEERNYDLNFVGIEVEKNDTASKN